MHQGLNNLGDSLGQNAVFNTTNDILHTTTGQYKASGGALNSASQGKGGTTTGHGTNSGHIGKFADKSKVAGKKHSVSGTDRRDRPPSTKKDGRGSSAKRAGSGNNRGASGSAKRAESSGKDSEAAALKKKQSNLVSGQKKQAADEGMKPSSQGKSGASGTSAAARMITSPTGQAKRSRNEGQGNLLENTSGINQDPNSAG